MGGPASSVLDVVSAWQTFHFPSDDIFGGHQASAHRLLHARPDLVTLDYTGSLFLNLGSFTLGTLSDVLEVRQGVVYNRAASREQCFIHGNAVRGKALLWQVLKHLVGTSSTSKRHDN